MHRLRPNKYPETDKTARLYDKLLIVLIFNFNTKRLHQMSVMLI